MKKELEQDPTAVSRKKDHIELAFRSQIGHGELDGRFYYEPLLSPHPEEGSLPVFSFMGKTMKNPIWVSSMTGGTVLARRINHNLARACAEFGLGMGLGSCRQLLYSDEHLPDFDVRDSMGSDALLFANLGIAQLEKLFDDGEAGRIHELVHKLRADGLIIHVNPLQEALQPEGDFFKVAPLETIERTITAFSGKIIVKEVGQGFGPGSLRALMQLPLAGIEFAAAGGTNFAKLELLRSETQKQERFDPLTKVGHSAKEMLGMVEVLIELLGESRKVEHLIISGGISDFLEGYYLIKKSRIPAVYGQASALLKQAQGDYEVLRQYLAEQIRGLELAEAFLRIR